MYPTIAAAGKLCGVESHKRAAIQTLDSGFRGKGNARPPLIERRAPAISGTRSASSNCVATVQSNHHCTPTMQLDLLLTFVELSKHYKSGQ
jgi:hypothetical protein